MHSSSDLFTVNVESSDAGLLCHIFTFCLDINLVYKVEYNGLQMWQICILFIVEGLWYLTVTTKNRNPAAYAQTGTGVSSEACLVWPVRALHTINSIHFSSLLRDLVLRCNWLSVGFGVSCKSGNTGILPVEYVNHVCPFNLCQKFCHDDTSKSNKFVYIIHMLMF